MLRRVSREHVPTYRIKHNPTLLRAASQPQSTNTTLYHYTRAALPREVFYGPQKQSAQLGALISRAPSKTRRIGRRLTSRRLRVTAKVIRRQVKREAKRERRIAQKPQVQPGKRIDPRPLRRIRKRHRRLRGFRKHRARKKVRRVRSKRRAKR